MKKTPLVFPLFIAVLLLIGYGTFWVGKNASKHEKAETVDCPGKGPNHTVEIKNNQIIPKSVNANICDELTLVNKDDKLRLIAFGVHDSHINYSGVTEKVIKKDEGLTITLNQAGTYIFHDHLQEEVQGQFSVL